MSGRQCGLTILPSIQRFGHTTWPKVVNVVNATRAYRSDDVNFNLSQDPRTVQKAYGIADFSIGINDNNGHYKVTAFVGNALDRRYANGIGDTTSGFSGVPGAVGSTWSLPRDAFRYFGARFDLSF